MKHVITTLVLLLSVASAYSQTDDEMTVDQLKAKYAAAAAEFSAVDVRNQEQFKLMPQSVLNWSNPERKTLAGGLFFWTSQSRPVIALSVYPDDADTFAFEFQSLTDRSFQLRQNEQPAWRPAQSGITWKSLDTTKWAVHKHPLVRKRQMAKIASTFRAKLIPPEKTEKPLRLQVTPVYRYPAKDLPEECEDGAVFCFVQGTDPEVLLMIEAIKDQSDTTVYRYALARMTMVPLQVHCDDELVFELDWATQGYVSTYEVIEQAK